MIIVDGHVTKYRWTNLSTRIEIAGIFEQEAQQQMNVFYTWEGLISIKDVLKRSDSPEIENKHF